MNLFRYQYVETYQRGQLSRNPLASKLKTKMKIKVTLYLIVLLLAGCRDNPVSSPKADVLYPLSTGNSWEYHRTSYEFNGYTPYTASLKYTVDGKKSVNGQIWYSIRTDYTENGSNFVEHRMFYTNSAEGFLVSYDSCQSSRLQFKYPAQVGDRYVQVDTTVVLGVNQAIQTSIGTFNCILYKRTSKIFITNAFEIISVCPGIGTITQEGFVSRDSLPPLKLYKDEITKLYINMLAG